MEGSEFTPPPVSAVRTEQGPPACRRCMWWRRESDTVGTCWRHADLGIAAGRTREDFVCDRFQAKVVMALSAGLPYFVAHEPGDHCSPACAGTRRFWQWRRADHCLHVTGQSRWFPSGLFLEYRSIIVRCCCCGRETPQALPTEFSDVRLQAGAGPLPSRSSAAADLLAMIDRHLTRVGRGVTYPAQLPAAVERLIADHAEQRHAAARGVAGTPDRYFAIGRRGHDDRPYLLSVSSTGEAQWQPWIPYEPGISLRFTRAADVRAAMRLYGGPGPSAGVVEVNRDGMKFLDR